LKHEATDSGNIYDSNRVIVHSPDKACNMVLKALLRIF